MTTNKIRIDGPAGIVEVEGDKDFVEGQIAKLLPVIQSGGFGSRPSAAQKEITPPLPAEAEVDTSTKTRTRRRPSNVPKGQSCRDRINVLRTKKFFSNKRALTDIVDGLAKEGWTHNINQVSASLITMFEKGEIQRTKEDGGFKYYWDRA